MSKYSPRWLGLQLVLNLSLLIQQVCFGQVLPLGKRLKDLAPPDLAIGGAMNGDGTDLQSPIFDVIKSEFNAVTTRVFMAHGGWVNGSDPINTTGWTATVASAVGNRKRVHGHVLVYPTENLKLSWFQQLPNDQVEATLAQYVATMAGSTSGGVWVWDVVNEVIGDNGDVMDADGLRMGLGTGDGFVPFKEYAALGSSYIAKAFLWARAADPNALLIINEYSAEHWDDKSNRLYEFCKKLRDEGVPIDGVGFQNHWLEIRYEPNYESIRANFQRFADAGFKIFITELDVAAIHTQAAIASPPDNALERQKTIYRELTQIALDQPACKSLLMWDFVDGKSWLQNTNSTLTLADRRPGFSDTVIPPGISMFATPFSGGNEQVPIQAKPAYYGIQEALANHTTDLYRITNGWNHDTSYLSRSGARDANGNWFPNSAVYFDRLDATSAFWLSMKWRLERVDTGVYRIRNLWGNGRDHLTLLSERIADRQVPSSFVGMQLSRDSSIRQKWNLISAGGGGYRLLNSWSPFNGFLTREASGVDSSNQFIPGSELRVYPLQDWSSQVWYFNRIAN